MSPLFIGHHLTAKATTTAGITGAQFILTDKLFNATITAAEPTDSPPLLATPLGRANDEETTKTLSDEIHDLRSYA